MIKFRTSPNGTRMEVAYLNIVALRHETCQIITVANAWAISVHPEDWDRVVDEVNNWFNWFIAQA